MGGVRWVDGAIAVNSVSPANFPTNPGVAFSITIVAQEMFQPITAVAGRAGYTACVTTTWESETTLLCNPGKGVPSILPPNYALAITVDQTETSTDLLWSYDSHVVTAAAPANHAAGPASVSISVHGSNFGTFDLSGQARFSTGCETTNWASDTVLVGRRGQGYGREHHVAVTIGGVERSMTAGVSYDVADVTGTFPNLLCLWFAVCGLRFAFCGLRFAVCGLGCGVWCSVFRIQGPETPTGLSEARGPLQPETTPSFKCPEPESET
jgi:hypothetical protein